MTILQRALPAAVAAIFLAGCGSSPTAPTVTGTPAAVTITTTNTTPASTSLTPVSVTEALTIDVVSVALYSFAALPSHYDAAVAALDNSTGTIDDHVATLGRVLFYDKKLSANDTVSCASCHQQAQGFSDTSRFSAGLFGSSAMSAHAPRLGNVRYYQPGTMFWNKRAATLEFQATQPIQDAFEMGFTAAVGGMNALITKMDAIAYYPDLFNFAFGDPTITESKIQQALAQFERAMVSTSSRWDTAYAQVFTSSGDRNINVDLPGFSAEENRGRALFMGGAGANIACAACHVPPTFSLDANARGIGLDAGETTVFKAPSLKNVALTGPYMHDGRFASLDQVLQHYDNGIRPGPALDPRLVGRNGNVRSFNLNGADRSAIIAFLRTLNDTSLTTDPRFSNPFR
jgi:cytochrome c peroxidase